jgi:hypothetical protein
MAIVDETGQTARHAFARVVDVFRNWPTTPQAYPLGYVPALDGARGLMTLGVMAAHTRYLLLPGAVLFMDIFFVMSGYLITSLLIADYRKRGAIGFKKFYVRRFLRLYPALAIMLAALLIVAMLFSREFNMRLIDSAVAFVYISDYLRALSRTIGAPSMGSASGTRHTLGRFRSRNNSTSCGRWPLPCCCAASDYRGRRSPP